MLKEVKAGKARKAAGPIAIVASSYNEQYVNGMLEAALRELKRARVQQVRVVRVPGAFEIPAVAAKLAEASPPVAAIVCFGVIFQGETSHAQHIGWGITHALAGIQTQRQVPVIHAVFVFDKEKQARVRCLGRKHNRGTEAAQTALEMARVMASL